MKSYFLKPNNPLLTRAAKKIPISQINSTETQEIIKTMIKIASGHRQKSKRPIMVGLAAPQIGISKRIILVDVAANGKGKVGDLRVFINPEITWASTEKGEWYEGCFSTSKVCGIVSRPIYIRINAYVQDAPQSRSHLNMREEKYTGYVARIFQHEIDHLNGIRFPDKISDPNKLHWVNKKDFPLYRDKQAWKNWPKKCSFEKWTRIKYPRVYFHSKN